MKLKAGQYVRHAKYGWGAILERSRNQTMVYFDTVGVKRFSTSLTAFAVVEHEAPRKKPVI